MITDLIIQNGMFECLNRLNIPVKKGDDSSITFEISFVFNGNDVDVSDILNILTEVKGCLSRLGLDFKKDTSTIMYGNGYCGIMFNIPIDCPFI